MNRFELHPIPIKLQLYYNSPPPAAENPSDTGLMRRKVQEATVALHKLNKQSHPACHALLYQHPLEWFAITLNGLP